MDVILPNWSSELDAHVSHELHRDPLSEWTDSNCYTDIWIEFLHGLGLDPYPLLAFLFDMDYLTDQWMFFKPPLEDIRRLYGIQVSELMTFRSLLDHALTHIDMGNALIMEVDSYFLPDVPSTYMRRHEKTTIILIAVSPEQRRVHYLHNAGLFFATDNDFDAIFRIGAHTPGEEILPPFVEVANVAAPLFRTTKDLIPELMQTIQNYLTRRSKDNPVLRFQASFGNDIARLAENCPGDFDAYAFSTLRQLGSSSALASHFVRWVSGVIELDLTVAIDALNTVSRKAKLLTLKAARAVRTRHTLDAEPIIFEMAAAWDRVRDGMGPIFARTDAPMENVHL